MSNDSTEITWDTLDIVPVKDTVVTHLSAGIGYSGAKDVDLHVAGTAMFKLFEYCIGFGVTTEPEESEELDTLCDLFEANTPRRKKVIWVQHIVCTDLVQTQHLLSKIMELNNGGDKG